jgi:peroxiredoxin
MKKIIGFTVAVILFSCNTQNGKGKFSVTGEIKNAPDQKIFLEQLYFSERNPEVLDTAELKNGKFTIGAMAPEEGLYRIRMEKSEGAIIFINDKNEIPVGADIKNISFKTISISTPANIQLKNFITGASEKQDDLEQQSKELQQYTSANGTDSIYTLMKKNFDDKVAAYKKYITDNVDNSTDPVVALFALGYSADVEQDKVAKSVAGLSKRFPKNQVVSQLVAQYNLSMQQQKQQEAANAARPKMGDMAPELTLPDTEGKIFSLSSLKGKYVLVDFWASWCVPCRRENPTVVQAYNTYKDKNFTVLGVSLDEKKEVWLEAIKADGLPWIHISDLKETWSSAAAKLYGFDAIPYNVLLDPTGKIIATGLRGEALGSKLAEILK